MTKKYLKSILPYQDAMDLFLSIPGQTYSCFLYSSSKIDYGKHQSIIGLFPDHIVKSDSIREAYANLDESKGSYLENLYVGHISYEVKDEIEELPQTKENEIKSKKVLFIKYGLYLIFDHYNEVLTAHYTDKAYLIKLESFRKTEKNSVPIEIIKPRSNFTESSYKKAVEKIKNYIIQGDVFEVNLTAKFYAELKEIIEGKYIFQALVNNSPSQYSAYLKHADLEIISSSPERFLHAENRLINSKPIKGTRKRLKEAEKDRLTIEDLRNSEKDRAENLMIVDLVRNDLGRVAKTASVSVPDLFKIESYNLVHQMVSTIECELDDDKNYLDLLLATFPPGSMTGAPKIRAMEIISELEGIDRGIYSGAIGLISPEKYLDLSVVIRTIIKSGKNLEFQAGGAIVYDSNADEEFNEMHDKLAAIKKTLNNSLKKCNSIWF